MISSISLSSPISFSASTLLCSVFTRSIHVCNTSMEQRKKSPFPPLFFSFPFLPSSDMTTPFLVIVSLLVMSHNRHPCQPPCPPSPRWLSMWEWGGLIAPVLAEKETKEEWRRRKKERVRERKRGKIKKEKERERMVIWVHDFFLKAGVGENMMWRLVMWIVRPPSHPMETTWLPTLWVPFPCLTLPINQTLASLPPPISFVF